MGVYVKDMEMPESCSSCPLLAGMACPAEASYWCKITHSWIEDVDTRLPDCPLIEVKTPHGYLIDANKAIKECGIEMSWSCQKWVGEVDLLTMPTVIKAEEH